MSDLNKKCNSKSCSCNCHKDEDPEEVVWQCRICSRTGFDKPTAHGCMNKEGDWKMDFRKIARAKD